MDAGYLPAFVGTMALPSDDGTPSAGVADETADRGFVAALAGALGDEEKGPEPARCRGGGATPVHPLATSVPEPAWPLLVAALGLPGPDALDQGEALGLDNDAASLSEGSDGDGAGTSPAGPTHAMAAGGPVAVPVGPDTALAADEVPAPGNARPGADTSTSFPDSDERSPMGTRAAFGRFVAGPEPARNEVDHGPLADAGRAEYGKLTGRTLFGGAEQGEPTLDTMDAGLAAQARWTRAVEQPRHDGSVPAPHASHAGRAESGAATPASDAAAAGRADVLSQRAAELAALASRGAPTPGAAPGNAPGPQKSPVAAGALIELTPVTSPSPTTNDADPLSEPNAAGSTMATSGAASRHGVSHADRRVAEVWPEELVQQVAIAGRALPGVGPKLNAETAFGGQDGSAGRGSLARGHGDAATAALAALGRSSPGEFAARISTLTQVGAPAFDQAAADPTVDGQPAGHAIVQSLKVQWRQGGGEARLRLQPEYLGELSLSLRVHGSTVSVVLRSDSPAVRGWIDAHQAELRRALEAQGLVLDRFVIDPDEDPRQSQEPSSDDQAPQRRRRQAAAGRFEALL